MDSTLPHFTDPERVLDVDIRLLGVSAALQFWTTGFKYCKTLSPQSRATSECRYLDGGMLRLPPLCDNSAPEAHIETERFLCYTR
jgi:hypothetical protein